METLIRPWRRSDSRRCGGSSGNPGSPPIARSSPKRTSGHTSRRPIRSTSLPACRTTRASTVSSARRTASRWGTPGRKLKAARTAFSSPSLYLLPAFQGKGIGGDLLPAAEETPCGYGLHDLWVGVMFRNEAARRWYARWGLRFARRDPFGMGRTTVQISSDVTRLRNPSGMPHCGEGSSPSTPGKEIGPPWCRGSSRVSGSAEGGVVRTWRGLRRSGGSPRAGGPRWDLGCEGSVQPAAGRQHRARVDPESVGRRSCFLCCDHLPPEQRAILYRETYFVLCNPVPIFPGHLTVATAATFPNRSRIIWKRSCGLRRISAPGRSSSITAPGAALRRPITSTSRRPLPV